MTDKISYQKFFTEIKKIPVAYYTNFPKRKKIDFMKNI